MKVGWIFDEIWPPEAYFQSTEDIKTYTFNSCGSACLWQTSKTRWKYSPLALTIKGIMRHIYRDLFVWQWKILVFSPIYLFITIYIYT